MELNGGRMATTRKPIAAIPYLKKSVTDAKKQSARKEVLGQNSPASELAENKTPPLSEKPVVKKNISGKGAASSKKAGQKESENQNTSPESTSEKKTRKAAEKPPTVEPPPKSPITGWPFMPGRSRS
jgi:hypothetical protein